MSEDPQPASPLATRAQVARLMRPHLVPLAALGVAATESVGVLMDRVIVDEEMQRKLRPKIEGVNVTAFWTEGVRAWVGAHSALPFRVHDPYNWVELVFHDSLHVRLHRDRPWRAATARQEYFAAQLPCPDFDRVIAESHAGNLELIAHRTPREVPALIRLHARVGSADMYEPITADPLAVAVQLQRWRAKEVPWLRAIDRLRHVGTLEDLQVWPTSATTVALPESDQNKESRFKARPRRRTDEQAGGDVAT